MEIRQYGRASLLRAAQPFTDKMASLVPAEQYSRQLQQLTMSHGDGTWEGRGAPGSPGAVEQSHSWQSQQQLAEFENREMVSEFARRTFTKEPDRRRMSEPAGQNNHHNLPRSSSQHLLAPGLRTEGFQPLRQPPHQQQTTTQETTLFHQSSIERDPAAQFISYEDHLRRKARPQRQFSPIPQHEQTQFHESMAEEYKRIVEPRAGQEQRASDTSKIVSEISLNGAIRQQEWVKRQKVPQPGEYIHEEVAQPRLNAHQIDGSNGSSLQLRNQDGTTTLEYQQLRDSTQNEDYYKYDPNEKRLLTFYDQMAQNPVRGRESQLRYSNQDLNYQLAEQTNAARYPDPSYPQLVSPAEAQQARDQGYDDYHNLYYEIQKSRQEERMRAFQKHHDYLESMHKANSTQNTARKYNACEEQDIGLGNPQNLAAFDLPLSQEMSSKAKQKQPRQGQAGVQQERQLGRASWASGASRSRAESLRTPRDGASRAASGRHSARESIAGSSRPTQGPVRTSRDRNSDAMDYRVQSGMKTQRQNGRGGLEEQEDNYEVLKTDRGRQAKSPAMGQRQPSQSRLVQLGMSQPKRKFSAAESQMSGQRLYENFKLLQNRKRSQADERLKEIQAQMQAKPQINKNTDRLLGLHVKVRRQQPTDFCKQTEEDASENGRTLGRNHQSCYFNQKELDEQRECTHKPKINKKSQSLLENNVLANLKRKKQTSEPMAVSFGQQRRRESKYTYEGIYGKLMDSQKQLQTNQQRNQKAETSPIKSARKANMSTQRSVNLLRTSNEDLVMQEQLRKSQERKEQLRQSIERRPELAGKQDRRGPSGGSALKSGCVNINLLNLQQELEQRKLATQAENLETFRNLQLKAALAPEDHTLSQKSLAERIQERLQETKQKTNSRSKSKAEPTKKSARSRSGDRSKSRQRSIHSHQSEPKAAAKPKKNILKLNQQQMKNLKQAMQSKPENRKLNIFQKKKIKPTKRDAKDDKQQEDRSDARSVNSGFKSSRSQKSQKCTAKQSQAFYDKNIEWMNNRQQKLDAEKERQEQLEAEACKGKAKKVKVVMDLKETPRAGGGEAGVHYADYHIFRQQQGPKTYREITEQKKSFEEYQRRMNPAISLRTSARESRRKEERSKNKDLPDGNYVPIRAGRVSMKQLTDIKTQSPPRLQSQRANSTKSSRKEERTAQMQEGRVKEAIHRDLMTVNTHDLSEDRQPRYTAEITETSEQPCSLPTNIVVDTNRGDRFSAFQRGTASPDDIDDGFVIPRNENRTLPTESGTLRLGLPLPPPPARHEAASASGYNGRSPRAPNNFQDWRHRNANSQTSGQQQSDAQSSGNMQQTPSQGYDSRQNPNLRRVGSQYLDTDQTIGQNSQSSARLDQASAAEARARLDYYRMMQGQSNGYEQKQEGLNREKQGMSNFSSIRDIPQAEHESAYPAQRCDQRLSNGAPTAPDRPSYDEPGEFTLSQPVRKSPRPDDAEPQSSRLPPGLRALPVSEIQIQNQHSLEPETYGNQQPTFRAQDSSRVAEERVMRSRSGTEADIAQLAPRNDKAYDMTDDSHRRTSVRSNATNPKSESNSNFYTTGLDGNAKAHHNYPNSNYEFLGQVTSLDQLSNSIDQSIVSGDRDYSKALNQHSYELKQQQQELYRIQQKYM